MNNLVALKKLSILFADDDDVFRESFAKTLGMLCENVLIAKDGYEALEIFHSQAIHIAILDVKMGAMSGLEVAKEIRKERLDLPIFIVSSYTKTDDLLEACSLNLLSYLVKPFNFQALCEALSKSLHYLEHTHNLIQTIDSKTSYNPFSKSLMCNNEAIALTKSEITLLELLIAHRGQVVLYDRIQQELNDDTLSIAAVKNIVLRLRKKVGESAIVNLHKLGYMLK